MAEAVSAHDVTAVLGSYTALQGISFSLEEGTYLAVLGPNGGGKSTLVKTLVGLVPLAAGRLEVFGRSPGSGPRGEIGYVPQVKTLDRRFPALPVELVVSGLRGSWPWRVRKAEEAQALQSLEIVGMADKARRPLGSLSGGELQRVYLARALVRQPRLVLLDEPATGMDQLAEADMYHLLEHYRQHHGLTVIMVTHDWDVASHHATHALLLNRQVAAFGPAKEAMTGDHLRRAFGHTGHGHPMVIENDVVR